MRWCCAANPVGDSDACSGLGDFGDRDGLNRAGGGPDVRSGLPGLSAQVRNGGLQLLRLQLHVAASVQRVGIGPRGTVRHQSIFRGRGRARGTTLSAACSRLLNSASEFSHSLDSDRTFGLPPHRRRHHSGDGTCIAMLTGDL